MLIVVTSLLTLCMLNANLMRIWSTIITRSRVQWLVINAPVSILLTLIFYILLKLLLIGDNQSSYHHFFGSRESQ